MFRVGCSMFVFLDSEMRTSNIEHRSAGQMRCVRRRAVYNRLTMTAALLEMAGVGKRFGDLVALDGVSLKIRPASVHGVLGENGAGKSTLMNVAYGLIRPDTGRLSVCGREVRFRSPRDAIASGVGMVHQHFMLAGAMTVLDNVLLGDRRVGRVLKRREAAERLVALGAGLGLAVEPGRRVEELSVGEQQRVEILKALWREVRVLILDEPTAVLTPGEVEQLFGAVERLRAEGRGVVFISHKLGEVRRICDEVTVLRRGRVVWEGDARRVSAEELAREMVGREVGRVTREAAVGEGIAAGSEERSAQRNLREELPSAPRALALEGVSVEGLDEVWLGVAAGEIVGIAGVDGNGQQQLAEAVVGLRRPSAGKVWLAGKDVSAVGLEARVALGVAHVPNDRKSEGLVTTMSVAENVVLKAYGRRPFALGGVMSWRRVRGVARELAGRFDVRATSVEVPVGTLSGGNQQKVVLARELAMREPKLIVAMNPVRGLDVAATNFVYERLLEARAKGAGVLLISSELDELLALCDRIGVLLGGRLTMTQFPRVGREEIGRLMAGVR
jgi:simple sugar transport system ATP-binding protein